MWTVTQKNMKNGPAPGMPICFAKSVRKSLLPISTISSSQSLLQARRAEAVDKLWKAILDLKIHYSPVILFFGITMPIEYKTALANSKIFAGLRTLDENYIINSSQNEESNLQKVKIMQKTQDAQKSLISNQKPW